VSFKGYTGVASSDAGVNKYKKTVLCDDQQLLRLTMERGGVQPLVQK
jgi:hypothetical protein